MRMSTRAFAVLLLAGGAFLAASRPSPVEAETGSLAAVFARPEQTVEYHFMIAVPPIAEADLARLWKAEIVDRLAAVAEVGPPKKPKPGIYVDGRDRGLERQNLIVRVRQGLITLKARASSADVLLDLAPCSAKKYEMDWFGTPDYSISSDIKFKDEEFGVAPTAWTPAKLWDFVAAKCPAAAEQIAPAVKATPSIEIPGVAKMYSAEAKLTHPAVAELAKDGLEAGVSVWYFPPTNRMLVELAFTGSVKRRAEAETIWADALAKLKASGALAEDQSSKTRQYFDAYFGPRAK
jgi:hypothetical protein